MSKERELLKKILATGWLNNTISCEVEELLAQPEHIEDKLAMVEPVAWMHEGIDETGETVRRIYCHFYEHANLIPLYTAPPKCEPLSDEKIYDIFSKNQWKKFIELARAIEKAHGIGGGE